MPLLGILHRGQIHTVELDLSTGDPAAVPCVAHCGQTDGRLAGTGLPDQPENLALPQVEIDPVHDLLPAVAAHALDTQAADTEENVLVALLAHSFNPLAL